MTCWGMFILQIINTIISEKQKYPVKCQIDLLFYHVECKN